MITEVSHTIVNSRKNSCFSPFYRHSCQNIQNLDFHIQDQLQHKVTLKLIFAEPVFTEIQFGIPASDDFMMIESLVSDIPTALKTPKLFPLFSLCKDDMNKMNVDIVTKNNIDIANVADAVIVGIGDADTTATLVDAEAINVEGPTVFEFRSDCNVDDVTVLPKELSSYSHCICFTSARRNRLKHLCTIASWRAIKLMGGWIMVILLVFWLASIFSLSTFPENPLKF